MRAAQGAIVATTADIKQTPPLETARDEEIDKMEAGPELDALVAEKVMGWLPLGHCNEETHRKDLPHLLEFGEGLSVHRPLRNNVVHGVSCDDWEPSTNITAAMEVVEKVWPLVNCSSGYGTYRFQLNRRDGDGMWICELATDPQGDWKTHRVGEAPTAPLAICRASLKAVMK